MKYKKIIFLVFIFIFFIFIVAGCNNNPGGNVEKYDPNDRVINVRLFKRGYGADWIYELKRQFEKTYKDEGYKVNILTPSPDMQGAVALSEIALGYDSSKVDLYITSNVTVDQVGVYNEILNNGKPLVEDIENTVFNQKAIRYDGTEEEKTVGEKLTIGAEKSLRDVDGTMYAFNWAASSCGLVINKRKLNAYGLDIPITSDQLFNCIDSIYLGTNGIPNSETSKTFPVTYPQAGNYLSDLFIIWQAQYDFDEYESFWSMNNENGEFRLDDGYEVFNSIAIESALYQLYRYMDFRIATYGSTTQSLDQAQSAVLKDKNGAVFMSCGDWFLNEVKLNYSSKLDDIVFSKIPINSELGRKLFGVGTSYNLSNAEADTLLAKIAVLADNNKSIEEIINEVQVSLGITLNEKDAFEVANARGFYVSYGLDHMAYITKNSPNKDICELFLRMMASDDFAQTFSEYANVNSPYSKISNTTSKYEFVRAASEISINRYAHLVGDYPWSGLRKQIGGEMKQNFPKYGVQLVSNVQKDALTLFDGNGNRLSEANLNQFKNAAHHLAYENYIYVKDKWQTYITGISNNK